MTAPVFVTDPGACVTRDGADILVCTVNTHGVMGAGVALAFRRRWPSIVPAYQAACAEGRLRPGDCLLLPLPDGRIWAALATKGDWRMPSRLPWIRRGLGSLADQARRAGARSIAIPPPGCGRGGLSWADVEPIVLETLAGPAGFDLRIYAAPARPAGVLP